MLYADRFSGHLDPEDPRTPVTAAGGCTWPTIPAYRLQLSSTNATGNLAFLQYEPIILELIPSPVQHYLATWEPLALPSQVYLCVVYKTFTPSHFPLYSWQLVFMRVGWDYPVGYARDQQGKCNRDVPWGDLGNPFGGGTFGSEFTQFQVEFNEDRHPDWQPPP